MLSARGFSCSRGRQIPAPGLDDRQKSQPDGLCPASTVDSQSDNTRMDSAAKKADPVLPRSAAPSVPHGEGTGWRVSNYLDLALARLSIARAPLSVLSML